MRDKTNGYIYYEYHKKTEKEEVCETAWKSVFNWLSVIVGILFVFFSVWIVFFHVIEVDGNSMDPTLRDGDRVLVSTFNYSPVKGDIIVAANTDENGVNLVKRVIATENQTVNVDYTSNTVYVDGTAIEEKYLPEEMKASIKDEISYPYTVPKGCIFLMGDNRNISMDSRSVELGCIETDNVVGKVVIRFSSDYSIY